jgi:ribonuclease HI
MESIIVTKIYFDGSTTQTACVIAGKRTNSLEIKLLERKVTSNEGEYYALIRALVRAKKRRLTSIQVLGDSELIIRQMNGVYRVKKKELETLCKYAQALASDFKSITFTWVSRNDNLAGHLLERNVTSKEIKLLD